jgi:putative phage-type endonuclease
MNTIIQGSKEWHAERAKGIGGSDAAAALGLSKWKTPFQLYLEKIGEAEPQEETWEMARGKIMEPLLRQHYADTTGRAIFVPKDAIVHPKYSFMRYNPDGLSEDGRLQEFKTATFGREWGEEGSDAIPIEYLIQVQHGMIVTERSVADCSVSIGGGKPKYFVIEADKELQEMIIEKEAKFWELVETRTLPEPLTRSDVAKMYKAVAGTTIMANSFITEQMRELHKIKYELKQLTTEKEALETIITGYMGEHEVLLAEDGFTIAATWKQAAGARRIDADYLRDVYPDIANACSKQGEPTRRFLLK